MNEEFLTVKELAVKLGVKAVTVYKWLRENKLVGTYFKLGGVYRFKKDKVDKVLEDMMNND